MVSCSEFSTVKGVENALGECLCPGHICLSRAQNNRKSLTFVPTTEDDDYVPPENRFMTFEEKLNDFSKYSVFSHDCFFFSSFMSCFLPDFSTVLADHKCQNPGCRVNLPGKDARYYCTRFCARMHVKHRIGVDTSKFLSRTVFFFLDGRTSIYVRCEVPETEDVEKKKEIFYDTFSPYPTLYFHGDQCRKHYYIGY